MLVEEDTGSAVGALGIVVIVGLLGAIWWFALGRAGPGGDNSGTGTDINVDVDLPAGRACRAAPTS